MISSFLLLISSLEYLDTVSLLSPLVKKSDIAAPAPTINLKAPGIKAIALFADTNLSVFGSEYLL